MSIRRRSSNDGSNSTPTTVHAVAELPYGKEGARVTDQRDYEGESSFYSQSKRIADTLSLAVSSASGNATDAQATAVGIVQTLIQDAKAADSPTCEEGLSQSTSCAFSQYPELAGLSLPPMDSVLRLLAFAKTSPQRYFVRFPHTDEEEFAELCQKLYFPTQPFTIFAWINANCGLFYLFRDLDKSHHDKLHLTKSQVSDAVAICSNNIGRAVRSLRLCVNPSLEAVDALVCAAAVNMEGAKGSLGWKLVSAAARMSIDLGYHRLPSGYGDRQRSQKRKLFWYVYSMDKSLAFNFGRSPTIQDYDVTTERPIYSDDFRSKWGFSFLGYIDLAKTQYDIYEQLFSAKAQQEPLPVRVHRVHEFAAKLSQIKTTTLNQKDVIFRDTAREVVYSTDIGFSSILTLLYRVLPPDDPVDAHGTISGECHPLRFHTLCVEAGRAALNALVYGWNVVSNELDEDAAKMFINWTLLFTPFMPYIAVFGNQIATGNQEDLILLRNVVKIVETAAEASSAMNKMYKAFSRLFRIAELWTSTSESRERRQTQSLQTQSVAALDQGSHFPASGKQPLSDGPVADVNMMAPTATDFSAVNWQDLDMSHQDWDMMFNEFDLGLGAESAREMRPWFEQHMSSFSTFG